jgi:hypothetical protein
MLAVPVRSGPGFEIARHQSTTRVIAPLAGKLVIEIFKSQSENSEINQSATVLLSSFLWRQRRGHDDAEAYLTLLTGSKDEVAISCASCSRSRGMCRERKFPRKAYRACRIERANRASDKIGSARLAAKSN